MKKAVAILLGLIISATLSACDAVPQTVGETQINGVLECINGNSICSEWRDTETRVHYFYSQAGGLEVRLNADGTPYTD